MSAASADASHPGDLSGHVQALDITKSYGPVHVLRGVTAAFRPGRVHTLMGENGAGKSTLFKVLAGITRPEAGRIELSGQSLPPLSPHDAHAHGIYLVPQEPALMPELSVGETMFVGSLPRRQGMLKLIDWASVGARARQALAALDLDIDVDAPARLLSIAQQQQVECAKALLRGCRIILFDEPTSPLTTHEVEILFKTVRRLRDDGCTLAFISHRMDEVLEISDDVSVLRDGVLVDTVERARFDRTRLLSQMVGRDMSALPRAVRGPGSGEKVLEVSGLSHAPRFSDVGFDLHRGEVLGLAGLVGAGRTEIAETIFGLRARDAGTVRLAGEDISDAPTHDIIRRGLVYTPEDRARHGAILPMTIAENVTSGLIERVRRRFGLMQAADEDRLGAAAVSQFRVRCAGTRQTLRELSGGNQQKVVFGKWMGLDPKVAILDEPTRGVDVGAKEEIYALIDELARAGTAVLVISSEMEELVRLCTRILSIYEGRIVAELSGDAITPERVGLSYLGRAEAHA